MYTNGNLEFSSQAEDGAEESDVEGEDAEDDSKVDPNEDPTASVDDDVHVRSRVSLLMHSYMIYAMLVLVNSMLVILIFVYMSHCRTNCRILSDGMLKSLETLCHRPEIFLIRCSALCRITK